MKIEVFADVICPFCAIGERRLELALEKQGLVAGKDYRWSWHPFQLRPDLDAKGMSRKEFMEEKFGGEKEAEQIFRQVEGMAAKDGLCFDFQKLSGFFNTVDSHRLILFAGRQGKAREMATRLMRAYFEEGADLSKQSVLIDLGKSVGIDADHTQKMLNSSELLDVVRGSQREAESLGINGVPFFILDRKIAISGAQSQDVFEKAIAQARK